MKKNGKGIEEFLDLLKTINDSTVIDSAVCIGEQIEAIFTKGRPAKWQLRTVEERNKGTLIAQGRGYSSFQKKLRKLELQEDCGSMLEVLCHVSTEPEKTWDGKIVSNWAVIQPGSPYSFIDNKVVIETERVELSPSDYRLMVNTGIAFRDGETYYPIMKEAVTPLAKFLNCESAFRGDAQFTIGTGLIIADRLAGKRSVKIVIRKRPDATVQPMIAMAGKRYVYVPQESFFRTVLEQGTALGIFMVGRWSITDDMTHLELMYPDERLKVVAETSDLGVKSMTLRYIVRICGGDVLVREDLFPHDTRYQEESVKESFMYARNDLDDLHETANDLWHMNLSIQEDDLVKLKTIVGKERMKYVHIPAGTVNAYKGISQIIREASSLELPDEQRRRLQRELKSMITEAWKHAATEEVAI